MKTHKNATVTLQFKVTHQQDKLIEDDISTRMVCMGISTMADAGLNA